MNIYDVSPLPALGFFLIIIIGIIALLLLLSVGVFLAIFIPLKKKKERDAMEIRKLQDEERNGK